MLHKTRGIVLNFIKYRDTSIIVKIYTEKFGLQSYIVNGVRSSKSRQKIALFQPLTLLDMVVYKKPHASINRLSELKCSLQYSSIPYDFKKGTLAIFLTEILIKSLKEEEENTSLFHFILTSLLSLDQIAENYESFHIQFMCKLSAYLGFSILSAEEVFSQVHEHVNHNAMAQTEKALLENLILTDYDQAPAAKGSIRKDILMLLIKFYSLHLSGFGEVRSLNVLTEVLH